MAKKGQLFKDYLTDIVYGALLYTMLLLFTWITWWLTELLWMPILTYVLKGVALLLFLVNGTILCILFVVYTTNDHMKEIFGKDWWRRFTLFLRRIFRI